MALYFEKHARPGETPLPAKATDRPSLLVRRLALAAGMTVILIAGVTQACGLLLPWEIRISNVLGFPSPALTARAPTVFLSLPEGTGGETADMDTALVLRGLSMLHPSLVLLAAEQPTSADSKKLLQGMKDRLLEKGISLVTAVKPTEQRVWRPVPLCRYLPPPLLGGKEPLPLIAGNALPEGTLRCLELPEQESRLLPLLSITASGEIVGSLWWEGLMHGQPHASAWLLADRVLLLPNHAALPFTKGGLLIPHNPAPAHTLPSDDFLLKMEERERGSLSPDFDSLWEHAVVVVGPPSLLPMTSALSTIREISAWRAMSLVWQGVIIVLLIGIVTCVFFMPQRAALLLVSVLFIAGFSGGYWALLHGLLPPILPWGAALLAAAISIARSEIPHLEGEAEEQRSMR